MRYGYARVSTTDQDCAIQVDELAKAGCEVIRQERKSGRTTEGRTELAELLAQLRKGDELWVSRLDRLGRSVYDVAGMVRDFNARGVVLRSVHENLDTSSTFGKMVVHVLAMCGELDYDMRRERQAAGIAKAKAEGKYTTGRPKAIQDPAAARALCEEMGVTGAAKRLGVSTRTVHRMLKAA